MYFHSECNAPKPIMHKILPLKVPPSLERNQTPFLFLIFYLLHSDVKNVLEGMKVAKIQHNTSLFHSKKRHSTSCLGTCKVHLLVFFGAIDSFCCLTLIWVHLLLCLLLLMCWPMVGNALALCIWKMFHLHPLYVYIFYSLKDAIIFWLFLHPCCTHVCSRKGYLTITNSN
jgi:hypothetical protein